MTPTEEKLLRQKHAHAWLRQFPVFKGGKPQGPLKIGIHKDITAIRTQGNHDFGHRHVNLILHKWTSSKRYLNLLLTKRFRYNLDGDAVDSVSAEARRRAFQQIKRKVNGQSQPKIKHKRKTKLSASTHTKRTSRK